MARTKRYNTSATLNAGSFTDRRVKAGKTVKLNKVRDLESRLEMRNR